MCNPRIGSMGKHAGHSHTHGFADDVYFPHGKSTAWVIYRNIFQILVVRQAKSMYLMANKTRKYGKNMFPSTNPLIEEWEEAYMLT